VFRTSGLEKGAVVVDGARRLVGLIVQLSKIVMRRALCGAAIKAVSSISSANSS
jgi:hypothetical protein